MGFAQPRPSDHHPFGACRLKTDAVLVWPPHAKVCEPGPGLLALAGHLRGLGLGVRLVDANLEVQEALLSSTRLGSLAESLAAQGAPRSWVTSARRIAVQAPRAVDALRAPATWGSPSAYRHALDTVGQAYRLLSRATGSRLSPSDLDCPGLSPLSSQDLGAIAEAPGSLPFADELQALVPALLADAPRLVGVSAAYLSQALPAFALAGMLRRAGYEGTLALGGGLVSSWAPRLAPEAPFFHLWDALVTGPGEEALEALLGPEVARRRAPGLLSPKQGVWNTPETGARATVCFSPSPEGLPWRSYLAPGPVLPVAASRGCYWSRCAFCPEAAEGRQGFQPASADELATALLRARDRHGFHHVHLTDDAVPPPILRSLARKLRGEEISWYGFARLERALLDPETASDLALGGCAMLQLGVESASQRLLDLLGKGTRVDEAGPVVENLSRAGIRTYVYLLFGSPTETPAEARATLEWAAQRAHAITFLNLALMNLPKGSALERDAERYEVESLEPVSEGNDLSLYWAYQGKAAGGRRDMRKVLAEARNHPSLSRILARTPPGFTSNHAAWAPLADWPTKI